MTTCLGKSCSFGLPHLPFVNCCQFMFLSYFPFGFEGRIWDLIVSVPDHCLSFYFSLIGPRQVNLVIIAYASSESSGEPAQGWTLTFSGQGPTGPLTFKI